LEKKARKKERERNKKHTKKRLMLDQGLGRLCIAAGNLQQRQQPTGGFLPAYQVQQAMDDTRPKWQLVAHGENLGNPADGDTMKTKIERMDSQVPQHPTWPSDSNPLTHPLKLRKQNTGVLLHIRGSHRLVLGSYERAI
jgi:hypothetical protein